MVALTARNEKLELQAVGLPDRHRQLVEAILPEVADRPLTVIGNSEGSANAQCSHTTLTKRHGKAQEGRPRLKAET